MSNNAVEIQQLIHDTGEMYRNVASRVSAGISLASCIVVIYIIFRSLDRLGSIYHRIILVMTVGDILYAIAVLFGSAAMPRPGISESVDFMFANDLGNYRFGNVGTCNAQGVIVAIAFTLTNTYSASLSWFYFCAIVKSMSDDTIQKRVEPFLHSVPLCIAIATGVISYTVKATNPDIIMCSIVPSPLGCEKDGTCDSDRVSSDTYLSVVVPFVLVFTAASILSIIFCLSAVCWKMFQLQRACEEEDTQSRTKNTIQSTIQRSARGLYGNNRESPIHRLRRKYLVASKSVVLQSLFYIMLCSSNAVLPLVRNRARFLCLMRLGAFYHPLRGFFDSFIFLVHKIHKHKNLNPALSLSTIVRHIFCEETADPVFISRASIVEDDEDPDELILDGNHHVTSLCRMNSEELPSSIESPVGAELFSLSSERNLSWDLSEAQSNEIKSNCSTAKR